MPLTGLIAIFSLVLLIDRTNGIPQGFWEPPTKKCECPKTMPNIKVSEDDKHEAFKNIASEGALTYKTSNKDTNIYTDNGGTPQHKWIFQSTPPPNVDKIDDRGFFCTEDSTMTGKYITQQPQILLHSITRVVRVLSVVK